MYINDCASYTDAISILDALYVTKRNEIFARHCLASRSQQAGESINEYLQVLKQLSKDCNFQAVSAEQNKNEYVRDAFIRGLRNSRIRERLLENSTITLQNAFDQARTLELAELNSASYSASQSSTTGATLEPLNDDAPMIAAAPSRSSKCYFCGNNYHPRSTCPARDSICRSCGKKGHFQKSCKSKFQHPSASTYLLASASIFPHCLQKSVTEVIVNGVKLNALIDTGSSLSFINAIHVKKCGIQVEPYYGRITMANSSLSTDVSGCCAVSVELQDHKYEEIAALVMKNLCADFLIGHNLLSDHSLVEINFKGDRPPLRICSLAVALVNPVSLFSNLMPDCKPITTKSRRQTSEDRQFISAEIAKLLSEGVIEPSHSPWRAQAFVVKGDNHKDRMVIDYSQTINKFTLLDAYPLPKIEELISQVAKNEIFSTIDLRSAYHQVPIMDSEKHYTAFEADGKLYQFLRVPFGVTNGVASFQRTIDKIIADEGLKGVYPYLDDVTICGRTQSEHDRNLEKFLAAVKKYNLTLNDDKCVYSVRSIKLLGYTISSKVIRPDPDRLAPLIDMPIPSDASSLQRALGMFAHYCRWIPSFSEKLRPLLSKGPFPLPKEAVEAFNLLKADIANASLAAIEDNIPFRVETDASEYAIGATLSQAERPIAFFSRTLSPSERKHASIEKEAYAIVESLRNWRHYLVGRHFEVFTDQRSVAFMFNQHHSSKIKNEKIMRWRLELACFKFDIIYRPGNKNATADALSRVNAATHPQINLEELHDSLCHPGITRMYHWVRTKNLPFSLEDIRKVTNSCKCCSEVKPRFCQNEGKLIKATSPFERLNMDFKGPLPSTSKNRYLLTVVDEFSRFPFAFPCSNVSADTVIFHLRNLFSVFGTPAFIHTDRGASFMSRELKTFLTSLGIATSRTTAYNPQGNGQVERYNGIIWKTIQLAVKSQGIVIERWEEVLQQALHSIRSLLCTATNLTPHERIFVHPRRSYHGRSLPTWLSNPGPVLLRNHVRGSKYEPIVQEVQLLEANPEYAHVKFPDGRETSVSLRHLAPVGEDSLRDNPLQFPSLHHSEPAAVQETKIATTPEGPPIAPSPPELCEETSESGTVQKLDCRDPLRPGRQRRQPAYLADYITN